MTTLGVPDQEVLVEEVMGKEGVAGPAEDFLDQIQQLIIQIVDILVYLHTLSHG